MIKFSNIEINFQFNFLLLCYNIEVYIMMLSLLYILKSNNYYLFKLIIFSYKHREKFDKFIIKNTKFIYKCYEHFFKYTIMVLKKNHEILGKSKNIRIT